MHNVGIIFRREFASYFATPLAFVFIIIFLVLVGVFAFQVGNFYEIGQADLTPFFWYLPWLYLVLIPPLTMRLWAEERREGTIELLMTLPIAPWQAVLGKFLAAWCFAAVSLALTFPMWITVNYLGDPDNGAIVTAYVGSLLVAGGFIAVGACLSAATRNQVIAFIFTFVVCMLLLLIGWQPLLELWGFLPQVLLDAVASLSFLSHFETLRKGVIDVRDLLYFGTLIATWLIANTIVLEMKKAD